MARSAVRDTSALAWHAAATLTNSLGSGFSQGSTELPSEVRRLSEELEKAQEKNTEMEVALSELHLLQELLHVHQAHKEKGSAVRVLSRPTRSPFDTFIIGAGSRNGVRVGDVALVSSGIAIGIVKEVGEETSVAHLFSAYGSEYEIAIADLDASFSYTGHGNGNGRIVVPRGVVVKRGDAVIMKDIAARIGVVGHIKSEPESTTQEILVSPPTNLAALTFVYLVHTP